MNDQTLSITIDMLLNARMMRQIRIITPYNIITIYKDSRIYIRRRGDLQGRRRDNVTEHIL